MELDPKKFDTKSRLLWELFLDSGFRISAVHSLKVSQLDLENNMFRGVLPVFINKSLGNSSQVVPK